MAGVDNANYGNVQKAEVELIASCIKRLEQASFFIDQKKKLPDILIAAIEFFDVHAENLKSITKDFMLYRELQTSLEANEAQIHAFNLECNDYFASFHNSLPDICHSLKTFDKSYEVSDKSMTIALCGAESVPVITSSIKMLKMMKEQQKGGDSIGAASSKWEAQIEDALEAAQNFMECGISGLSAARTRVTGRLIAQDYMGTLFVGAGIEKDLTQMQNVAGAMMSAHEETLKSMGTELTSRDSDDILVNVLGDVMRATSAEDALGQVTSAQGIFKANEANISNLFLSLFTLYLAITDSGLKPSVRNMTSTMQMCAITYGRKPLGNTKIEEKFGQSNRALIRAVLAVSPTAPGDHVDGDKYLSPMELNFKRFIDGVAIFFPVGTSYQFYNLSNSTMRLKYAGSLFMVEEKEYTSDTGRIYGSLNVFRKSIMNRRGCMRYIGTVRQNALQVKFLKEGDTVRGQASKKGVYGDRLMDLIKNADDRSRKRPTRGPEAKSTPGAQTTQGLFSGLSSRTPLGPTSRADTPTFVRIPSLRTVQAQSDDPRETNIYGETVIRDSYQSIPKLATGRSNVLGLMSQKPARISLGPKDDTTGARPTRPPLASDVNPKIEAAVLTRVLGQLSEMNDEQKRQNLNAGSAGAIEKVRVKSPDTLSPEESGRTAIPAGLTPGLKEMVVDSKKAENYMMVKKVLGDYLNNHMVATAAQDLDPSDENLFEITTGAAKSVYNYVTGDSFPIELTKFLTINPDDYKVE